MIITRLFSHKNEKKIRLNKTRNHFSKKSSFFYRSIIFWRIQFHRKILKRPRKIIETRLSVRFFPLLLLSPTRHATKISCFNEKYFPEKIQGVENIFFCLIRNDVNEKKEFWKKFEFMEISGGQFHVWFAEKC